MEPTTRLIQILEIIKNNPLYRKCNIIIEKHIIEEEYEYIRLIIKCNIIKIHIREYIENNTIKRYSYQLLIGSQDILRYDNTPHHREIETHPHHKHKGRDIYPLHNHTIDAFLQEATEIINNKLNT